MAEIQHPLTNGFPRVDVVSFHINECKEIISLKELIIVKSPMQKSIDSFKKKSGNNVSKISAHYYYLLKG